MRSSTSRFASILGAVALIASTTVITAAASHAAAPAASSSDAAYVASVGECFNYAYKDMSGVWVMAQTPVDCTTKHTATTIYIGPSKSITTMPPAGKLTEAQAAAFRTDLTADGKTCRDAMLKAVGPAAELSRYGTNQVYQPSATGGVDLRCDAILYTPNYKSIQGLHEDIMDTAPEYMRCAKLTNNNTTLTYRACGRGVGIASQFDYLNKNGTKAYPGEAKVRIMIGRACGEANFWGANTSKEAWKAGASYTCYVIQ